MNHGSTLCFAPTPGPMKVNLGGERDYDLHTIRGVPPKLPGTPQK